MINGEVGESLGYEFGVQPPGSENAYYFPTRKEAVKIYDSFQQPGAKLVMREVYATLPIETSR